MKHRALNSLPFVGIIAVITLRIYYGEQTKPTYRDCVELSSAHLLPICFRFMSNLIESPSLSTISSHQEKNNSRSLNERMINNGYNSTMP